MGFGVGVIFLQDWSRDLGITKEVLIYFLQEVTLKEGCKNGQNTTCSDDDHMMILNGALAGIAAAVAPVLENLVVPPEIDEAVSGIFKLTVKELILFLANHIFSLDKYKEELIKKVTVAELIFDGYETGILNAVNDTDGVVLASLSYLGIDFPNIDFALDALQQLAGDKLNISLKETYYELKSTVATLIDTTPQVAGYKFGIFKGKNATKADSYYMINTGKYERHNFLEIEEFNGKEKLPEAWWPYVAPTPTGQDAGVKGVCHEIYGTDGSQFPPFVDKDARIWIYVAELCRQDYLTLTV